MVGTGGGASLFHNLGLLHRRRVRRVAVLVVPGDRGLAGPFNGQVLRRAFELERRERAVGDEVLWAVVGRRGASTPRLRRYEVATRGGGVVAKPAVAVAPAGGHLGAQLCVKPGG